MKTENGKCPIIGITLSLDHGRRLGAGQEYVYVKRAYAGAIARAGGYPVHVSPELAAATVATMCDGLVISGGDDIPPELYGEVATAKINEESQERIRWERELLDAFFQVQAPLLGVCYGMQLMNVHHGGTLLQDIRAANPAALDHGGNGNRQEHDIIVASGSFLHPVLGATARVCSTHHQAVAQLAAGFTVAARATDGTIEAIEHDQLIGVEWHPEADTTGDRIYRMLVERARKWRARETN